MKLKFENVNNASNVKICKNIKAARFIKISNFFYALAAVGLLVAAGCGLSGQGKSQLSTIDGLKLQNLSFRVEKNTAAALKEAQEKANKENAPLYEEAKEIIERACKANGFTFPCDVDADKLTVKAHVAVPPAATPTK